MNGYLSHLVTEVLELFADYSLNFDDRRILREKIVKVIEVL